MEPSTNALARGTHLLIVDPQNDFCDLPDEATPPGEAPTLPVPGAHADMLRLARFIQRQSKRIDAITITLDSHHRLDVAHPGFWRRGDGRPVQPFTEIRSQQLESGEFSPADSSQRQRCLDYLHQLESGKRYTLMVWPEHCIMGTWGQQVHDAVNAAANEWAHDRGREIQFARKGQNPWTEHYSALQAEVPDPADPDTQFNQALADWAGDCDTLFVAGEAGSHCVMASLQHLLDHWPAERARHVTLLRDCVSPVKGFESTYENFLQDIAARGVRLVDSTAIG